MHALHLVTRDHFPSCDKDGGHTIRSASAIVENTMLHAEFMDLCFIERVIADPSSTLRE